MIKTLTLIVILGAACFFAASSQKKYIPPKPPLIKNDSINIFLDTSKSANATKSVDESAVQVSKIQATVKVKGDSVVIRWAPALPGAWVTANNMGYIVERIEDKEGTPVITKLTTEPLKPWPLEELKKIAGPDNKYAAIAAQVLYGKISIDDISAANTTNEYVRNLKYAAQELTNRHGFALFAADMDPVAASGLALRFVDRSFKKGNVYTYKISVFGKDPMFKFQSASLTVNTAIETPPVPAPSNLNVKILDKALDLNWKDDEYTIFSAYNLYKKDDYGNFVKLNKNPIVPIQPSDQKLRSQYNLNDYFSNFIDSNLINYKSYTYCLKGINEFAEESPCQEITAFPKDLTPPLPPKLASKQTSDRSLKLTWEKPVKEPDLAGYRIVKSRDYELDFEPVHDGLLNPADNYFIDSFAIASLPYYKIYAFDTSGNVSASIPHAAMIVDTIPPLKPEGLSGSIDSLGRITLTWELGPEDNIIGYRILFANDSLHEFTPVVSYPVDDIEFRDSVNLSTLSEEVYYRIVAVNNKNQTSEFSDILKIVKPDKIPPTPAIITGFSAVDSVIIIKWEPSSSKDVKLQTVLRRNAGSLDWIELKRLDKGRKSFIDFEAEENVEYEYAVNTIDDSGLESLSPAYARSKRIYNKLTDAVEDLKAEYEPKIGKILLTWDYRPKAEINTWVSILRSYTPEGGTEGELTYYDSVPNSKNYYNDLSLIGKGKYKYRFRIDSDAASSSIYKEIVVEIK